MSNHRGPIFSLKWNQQGNLVLSGSADTTTIVWDPATGEMKQQFELHSCKSFFLFLFFYHSHFSPLLNLSFSGYS